MVKRKNLATRIATCALAGILGFGPMLSNPLLVHAANENAGNGELSFEIYDSSVYGADRTTGNVNAGMVENLENIGSAALKEYWGGHGLKTTDFLKCPQGLATFRTRVFEIYDVSVITNVTDPSGSTSQQIQRRPSNVAGNNEYGTSGYFSYAYLTNETDPFKLVDTITVKGGSYGVDFSNNTKLEKGHYYVIVEKPDAGENKAGYYVNTDGAKKGWQVRIDQFNPDTTYNFTYNDTTGAPNSLNNQPYHNEVMRGGISFDVWDKDLKTYQSEGEADITKAVFAVYNISSTQYVDGADYERWDVPYQLFGEKGAYNADGSSPVGYVIADRDNSGHIESGEQLSMIPAYTESDIISAYTNYLVKCREAGKISGDCTDNTTDGEFILGQNSAGKPIIPVMLLSPDENGHVETSSVALPVGNYIILQVQAGEGYYIDEDFRPIVSMGSWSFTDQSEQDRVKSVGYGNSYPQCIEDNTALTFILHKTRGISTIQTDSPVAYCPTHAVTNLSNLASSVKFYVPKNGNNWSSSGTFNYGNYGPLYVDGIAGPSGGNYQMNSNDARMKPVGGTSKFIPQNAVIRAGITYKMADADDLHDAAVDHKYTSLNIGADGKYIIIPQGDGDLTGAQFKLTNMSDTRNPVHLYASNVTIGYGESYTYTVNEENKLLIPTDDLAYGTYSLEQVTYGEGYAADAWTTQLCNVPSEDRVLTRYTDNNATYDHSVANEVHLPNDIINGGELFSLASNTATADAKVTISVYNVSDQYVYVDKDGDGVKERFETYQDNYNTQILGKSLDREQLVNIVKNWTACSVEQVSVDQVITKMDRLPYGRYLAVITEIPTGYSLVSEYVTYDDITSDTDKITLAARIELTNTIPVITSTFENAETKLDSIPVQKKVFLQDRVEISNLEGGKDYIVYGVIGDKETSDILAQGCVAYTKVTAYKSTGTTPTTPGNNNAALDTLIAQGTTFTVADADYVLWLNEVKNYATEKEDTTLIGYCNSAIDNVNNVTAGNTNFSIEGDKAKIIGHLKYLAGHASAGDVGLDGTASGTILFNYVDTSDMEGKTLVAFDYVCSGSTPSADALSATTTGALLATLESTLLGVHKNVLDEDQTVYLPTLDITAEASYTGVKTIDPSETVKATVSYGNVEIGNQYKVVARIFDEYGNAIMKTDENGKETEEFVLEEKFQAYATADDVEFVFDGLDVAKYNEQRLTVYATLYRVANNEQNVETDYWLIEKGDADSMGYDINDPDPGKNQVDVLAPTVKTVLADKYGNKVVDFDTEVTLVDTVTYKNLVVGGKYKAELTLVNSEGIALLDDDGNALKATVEFTADEAEKVVEIPITFNGKDIQGMEIVAFNDLYRITSNRVAPVAQEHNVKASDQTIEASGDAFKVIINTVALDATNNTHVVSAVAEASAVDHVEIRNLDPSEKYILVTELGYATNGNVVTQFSPIETEIKTDTDGRVKVDIPIQFNATVFAGQKLVVFQTVYDANKDNVIAEHKNKNDANQTLMVPAIDTVATANDGTSKKIVPEVKEINPMNKEGGKKEKVYSVEIMDTITYTNLIAGNAYTITTEVVSRDGKGSLGTTTTEFVPTVSNGTTSTFITVDVSKYIGSELVVYEVITDTYSGAEVVIHKDITDKDQTVEIVGDPSNPDDPTNPDDPSNPDNPNDPGKPGTNIQTGVAENFGLFFTIAIVLLVSALGIGGFYLYRRKKAKS